MSTSLTEASLSEAELRSRARAKELVARAMVEDREHCREAWVAAGFAVEFAAKAAIMRREGWAAWPEKAERPDLYTHTLKPLFTAAGVDTKMIPKHMRASIRQVLDWERRHDYVAKSMPRKLARSMVDAAFGVEGVVQWLNAI